VSDSNDLLNVFFVDDNTGWIVGSDGFITKTTNAGLDWVQQSSGTTLTLTSVMSINQNTGWISGEGGLILKTTDGGQNWFELTSGTFELLTDLHFFDLNIGWVVGDGGTILKTTNGGSSWISQSSDSSFDLNSIDFVDSFVGYAVGFDNEILSAKVLKTTDGGVNWINKSAIFDEYNGLDLSLNTVKFIDADTGFVGGGMMGISPFLSKTTDGGDTWILQTLSNNLQEASNEAYYFYPYGIVSIYFKDSNTGFAVGYVGPEDTRIWTTTDGGSTWILKFDLSMGNYLTSVYVNSTGKGWAVGGGGLMFITEDEGNSWALTLNHCDIHSVFFVTENTGWAAGYGIAGRSGDIIFKTTNGGKIWKSQFFGSNGGGTTRAVYFLDENIGWTCGIDADHYTTDGGENWSLSYFPGNTCIFFIDQNTGWNTADNTQSNSGIYKSTDGGISWTPKSTQPSSSIFFVNANIGWAVGASGNILKSTDGGETWNPKTSGTTSDLNCVKFYNSNLGMCVGNAGTVLLSTDGGETWISQNSGTANDLKSITFTNSTSAWVAGNNGTIQQTTDLGSSWTSYGSVTTNSLNTVFFINENTGWVGGLNETIFKYSTESILTSNHFTPIWSDNPYSPMNIYVTSVTVDGVGLVAGDEIGVFDGDICVGSIVLTEAIPSGGFASIIASTDDPNATGIDGFTPGHTISYKFWLSSIAAEITDYTAIYSAGDGTFASQGTAVVSFESVIPVELTSFTADVNNAQVDLKWQTATEINNYGFDIERASLSASPLRGWEKIGFVEGNGNSISPKEYSFTDSKLNGGIKFQYRLKQIDNDGQYEYSKSVEIEVVTTEFVLYQNYPNPFNPTTKIRYQLPQESKVVIKIYSILGSEVMEILNEQKEAGVYEIEFSSDNLSSGTYIYKISATGGADNFVQTKKMILLK